MPATTSTERRTSGRRPRTRLINNPSNDLAEGYAAELGAEDGESNICKRLHDGAGTDRHRRPHYQVTAPQTDYRPFQYRREKVPSFAAVGAGAACERYALIPSEYYSWLTAAPMDRYG